MDNHETLYFNISIASLREMIADAVNNSGAISETDSIFDIDITSIDDLGIDARVVIEKE